MAGEEKDLSEKITAAAKAQFAADFSDMPESQRDLVFPIYLSGYRSAAIRAITFVSRDMWEAR